MGQAYIIFQLFPSPILKRMLLLKAITRDDEETVTLVKHTHTRHASLKTPAIDSSGQVSSLVSLTYFGFGRIPCHPRDVVYLFMCFLPPLHDEQVRAVAPQKRPNPRSVPRSFAGAKATITSIQSLKRTCLGGAVVLYLFCEKRWQRYSDGWCGVCMFGTSGNARRPALRTRI